MGRSFVWQTELLAAQMDNPSAGRGNLWGGYSFIEHQLSRRWYMGLLLDYSQIPFLGSASELSIAPYVNFWQSEFGRFRLQYQHTIGNQVPSHDQLLLQYTVTMGNHRPHPF
jgi:hypothetical protein